VKKQLFFILALVLLLVPVTVVTMQDNEQLYGLEVTGVNSTNMPEVLITASVINDLGQPLLDLTVDNFVISGELADIAEIVHVENITVEDVPISAVLVIDTSTSMEGEPFARAKEAATLFVETLSEGDYVAIIIFDSSARLIQDYTDDKELLLSAIDKLPYGGVTALYDAGLLAVEVAGQSPTPRRVVVMLSDGAEYGGASSAERETALQSAHINGVTVYTIGLGWGADRTYLEELSLGTNAAHYESPSPKELPPIYAGLAEALRTHYIITLNIDLPLDGTEYDFVLQAITDSGASNEDNAIVRAPIPVPIVTLHNLPEGAISEAWVINAMVGADDDLSSVTYDLQGMVAEMEMVDDVYSLAIAPEEFAPGIYSLSVTATDVDGDTNSVSTEFEIAALPPVVTISTDVSGLEIGETVEIMVEAEGQTPISNVTFIVDDEAVTLVSAPFTFTIDPLALMPGDHVLTIEVVNEGGATTSVEQTFSIVAFAPEVELGGIVGGQVFEDSYMPDDTITVNVEATSAQTDITSVVYSINGQVIETKADAPYDLTLPIMELGQGTHTLDITVTNEGGQTTTTSATFEVVIVSTPTPTIDVQATADAQATAVAEQAAADAQVTADAQSTAVAEQAAADAQATADTEQAAADAQATVDAEPTAVDEEATVDAEPTAVDEEATADTEPTAVDEEATADAEPTAVDEEATADAEQAAADEEATADAEQAAVDEEATVDAEQAAADEEATADAEQVAADEEATADAEQAAADEQATADAEQVAADEEATADAEQAAADEQATADAEQAAADEQATADAEQAAADEQATADAEQAAADEQATADAEQAAADEEATADAEQAAADEEATADAEQAAADEEATVDAEQAAADEQATTVAEPTDTVEPTGMPAPTELPAPTLTPSGELTNVEAESADDGGTDILPILVGGIGLLLLVLIGFFLTRGGKKDK
jgi:uncharacterized protein YegL